MQAESACAGPVPPPCSRQVSIELPMPYEGDAKHARALWAQGAAYNPMVINATCPDYTYLAAATNTVARPDASRLGGITPEIIPMPYYQPGTQTIRQPQVNGDTGLRRRPSKTSICASGRHACRIHHVGRA